ncbi:MAG: imidazole glycerol phosphate synthase subunit HisH [Actinomycetota bacterium]
MADIAVIDYGMGNLRSVAKAIEHVAPGRTVCVTDDPLEVERAGRVVFPGQGAMPDCMRELDARGLRSAVMAAAANKPFLGICIGLQMLFERSEEGDVPGLGLFHGRVRRFSAASMVDATGARLKVPHMGWNRVRQLRAHPLWDGIEDGARFYFVHSYVAPQGEFVAAHCDYGSKLPAAIERENLWAVQFHPEKSGQSGLAFLGAFVEHARSL